MGHTLLETVPVMGEHNIGAVPELHNGKLVGIVSERDLTKRVVAEGRDPRSTCMAEAMTDDPLPISMNKDLENWHNPDAAPQFPSLARLPRRPPSWHGISPPHPAPRFERAG